MKTVCSPSLLMMTGPGLALFYGGLVRKKNVLGTMMQSFALMAVVMTTFGSAVQAREPQVAAAKPTIAAQAAESVDFTLYWYV